MFLEALFLHSVCVIYKGHTMDCPFLQCVSCSVSWDWTLWESRTLEQLLPLPGVTGLPGSLQEEKKCVLQWKGTDCVVARTEGREGTLSVAGRG